MTIRVEATEWSELSVDVSRLRRALRQPGHVVDEQLEPITVRASLPSLDDLQITTSRIRNGSTITADGSLDVATSGVVGRLAIEGAWEGECRRCLEPVVGEIVLDVETTFLDVEAVDDVEEGEAYPIIDERVDLAQVLRDELMLALPLSPLCAGDCAGADPERFPATGRLDLGDEEDTIDPRWAALSELTFDEGSE